MVEVWKPIKNYEGCYEISNLGRVKSLARQVKGGRITEEIILKPVKNSHGYLQVDLCLSGKMKHHKIHRLVAEAFIPKTDEAKDTVNHIDYNKFNNCVDNLEWLSNRENVQDYFKKKGEREG